MDFTKRQLMLIEESISVTIARRRQKIARRERKLALAIENNETNLSGLKRSIFSTKDALIRLEELKQIIQNDLF